MEEREQEMWIGRTLDVLQSGSMTRDQIGKKLGGFDEGSLELLLHKTAARGLIEADYVAANRIYWRLTEEGHRQSAPPSASL